MLAAAAAMAAAASMGGPDYAEAAAGTYVDSVTLHKYGGSDAVTQSIIDGEIDMSYLDISRENAQAIRDSGHDLYKSVGGAHVRPVREPDRRPHPGVQPVSQNRKARFALNYMLDRTHVAENLLSSGSEMYSALTPYSYDYPLVYRYVESLEFDSQSGPRRRPVSGRPLSRCGGRKVRRRMWHYDGTPIEVTVFIRADDPVRLAIGERLSGDLVQLGFKVTRTYGDLRDAFATVYATDPADQQWHVYTGSWTNFRGEQV